MNKFLRIILLFCIAFTLESNAMQPKLITLKTNLGTLTTKLQILGQKLEALKNKLSDKIQPEYQKNLDIYALYGDNPGIINDSTTGQPRELKLDKDKNLRLVGLENTSYTGYGYKTANLRELQNIIKEMKIAKPTTSEEQQYITQTKKLNFLKLLKKQTLNIGYAVPDFIGISSENIKKYLLSKSLNISKQWKDLTSTIPASDQKASLQSKNLPTAFVTGINGIEKAVKNKFLGAAAISIVDLDKEFNTSGIKTFLSTAKAKNLKLMVRSTGKEDTDQLANAGGNETIGNVDPIDKNILMAMGQGPEDPINKGEFKLGVVSSYFGLKSFTQRIKAGDLSLYEEPPTPALIQVMIGETPDEITSCGVMFTEEPEGGISQKKEINSDTGQIKTTGITRIECSYGHNEGVVNSMVPVDVYYIDNKKEINSIIRIKDKRIIPTPKGFQITTNDKRLDGSLAADKDLPNQPALSKEEVKALKTLSNYLEFHYKKPMDVEFVLKKANPTDKKRTIYLVQARPIVHNDKKITPSYILKPEDFTEKVTGEVIGIAGGALRLVKSRNECVIAETLKEALEIYQKLDSSDNINCIFVKNMAPATSHEATQFRTEQKAVMCVPEVQIIEKWLQENKFILIDIQQELVTAWDGDPNLEEALKNDTRLHDGWINYPIPMKLTLDDLKDKKYNKKFSALSISEINANFKEFLNSDYFKNVATMAQDQAKKDFIKKKGAKRTVNLAMFRICFNSIKKDVEESAKLNLCKLCLGLSSLINQMLKQLKDDDFTYQSKLILNHLLIHAKQVSSVLKIQPSDANYFQRLYEVRFLESILFQTSSNDIFNNYSLENLTTNIYAKEKSIEKELRKTVPMTVVGEKFNQLVQYGKAAEFILTDDLKAKWNKLLTQLPNTDLKTDQKKFNVMFDNLAKNNLLTVWFLLSVEPVIKNKNITSKFEAHNIIDQLYSDYNTNKPFIDELKKQRDKFNELEISLWSSAHKFGKQKENLEKIGAYFKNQAFFDSYNASGNLGKVFATQVMEEFITLFDTSIKQLESSLKEYPDEQTLITNIKTLITLFLSFLSEWINKFPGAINIDGANAWGGQTYTQQKYDTAQATLSGISPNSTNYNDQIKISPTFDVGASAIGGSKETVANLTTLEDIFTFTHQSLLNILGFLNKSIDIFGACPQIISRLNTELTSEIKTLTSTAYVAPKDITLAGLSIEGKNLKLKYNYPLRGHSMTININFEIKTKITTIACEIAGTGGGAGGNEFARFYKIGDYIDVTSKALNLKSNYRFEIQDKKIIWEWKIDSKTPDINISKIKNLIFEAVCISYAVNNYHNAMAYEAKIYQETFNFIDKNALTTQIIIFSEQKERLHSVFVTALENLPQNATSCNNWAKTIEILGKLINENNPYRINTECFFFKKYHDPYMGGFHHQLNYLNIENTLYHELTSKNYLSISNTEIQNIDLKRNYFKFREAKKIFNYLCQVSQYFDENCWNKFLDLIKSNTELVLGLEDLTLDDMEGDGPAAANLENTGTQGRTLKLHNSISKLFNNGFTSKVAGVKDKAKATAENLIAEGNKLGIKVNQVKTLIEKEYNKEFKTSSHPPVIIPPVVNPTLTNTQKLDQISGYSTNFASIPPSIISTLKSHLLDVLNDTNIADNIVPGDTAKRNNLVNFAESLINKSHMTKDEIWTILQASGTNTKRKSLICIQILFKTHYDTKEFFDLSIPLIFSQINANDGASNYSKIANDCYTTLYQSIIQNKYSHQDKALLKTTLQSLALTPGSYPQSQKEEIIGLL